ncbi:MAG: Ig-like domain-containing protein [Calditrichia bacterium]
MKQRKLKTALLITGLAAMAVINGCLPSPDYEPPVVTILNPAPEEVVAANDRIPILAVASDDFELKEIVILIEGVQVLSTSDNPAKHDWTVVAGAVGTDNQYHIAAYAVDAEDHIGPSAVIACNLQAAPGAPAVEPPTAEIIAPDNGAVLKRSGESYRIAVDAFDNTAVERVEFYANGQLIGESTEAPYELNWNVKNSGISGRANIFVKAFDNEGFSGSHVTAVTIR